MSKTLVNDLRESAHEISRITLDSTGGMEVQGSWSTEMNEAADRIEAGLKLADKWGDCGMSDELREALGGSDE